MAGRQDYLLSRILNENRGYLIDDTTDYTSQTNISGLIVLEDTVISNLEVGGSDVLSDMNLSAKTLTTSFHPIMAGESKLFSRIKLTSGSVWAIMNNDNGIVS